MDTVTVGYKKVVPDAMPFAYAHEGDAAMDIFTSEEVVLPPKTICKVGSGIALQMPYGYCGKVTGRSGLTLKGLIVYLGLIDENYSGEICVICENTTSEPMTFPKYARIAQILIEQSVKVFSHEVKEIYTKSKERGENGFGSSGI